MKKNVIFLLIFFFAMKVSAQADVVNIPDENFKNYLLGDEKGHIVINGSIYFIIDKNLDKQISYEEAAEYIGSLDLQNKNIKDFTGLEAFTKLKSLNLSGNPMEKLSLNGKDMDLEVLEFFDNENKAKINQIDISSCKKLKKLNLEAENSGLTTINLPQSPDLEEINIKSKNIGEINVSSFGKLKKLTLFYCNNKKLDLSSNKTLERFFSYWGTLEEVDLANGNNHSISSYGIKIKVPTLKKVYVDAGAKNHFSQGRITKGAVYIEKIGIGKVEVTAFQREAKISWEPVEGASGYKLILGETIVETTESSVLIADLEINKEYEVLVRGKEESIIGTKMTFKTMDYVGANEKERIPFLHGIGEDGSIPKEYMPVWLDATSKVTKVTYFINGVQTDLTGQTLNFPKTGKAVLKAVLELEGGEKWERTFHINVN